MFGHSRVSAGRREDNRGVRRAWLPMLLLAFLASGSYVESSAAGSAATLTISWPSSHLQLGLADAPGGAGLAAAARVGLRYQYLAGGVNTGKGWQTWDPDGSFVSGYVAESEAHHLIPVFSYYQIRQSLPGAGIADETSADLGNLDNQATMRAYYLDLKAFFVKAAHARGPVVLHLEPDLFGYIEQRSHGNDASTVPAAVASTGIAELRGLPDSAAGFAQAVLALRRDYAPKVIVGYPISIWGTGKDIHLSHPSASEVDAMAAASAAFYRSLHAGFDVTFTELADRDAGYAQTVDGASGAWWNAVDYGHDLRFLREFHQRVARPIVMWQIPLGNTVSPVVNNTPYHYRDNKVQWFLAAGARGHLESFVRAGVVALLFGGGQAQDTDTGEASGDGRPDDGGYFNARARAYYKDGPIPLSPPAAG
jgi:hypothetical protein